MPAASKIRMEVKGLVVDPVTNVPMVILRGDEESYVLPIWVGVFEANAIALQVERIETPRPMTHDLLRAIIQKLGAEVQEVAVTDLRESTFYASIVLKHATGAVTVDARPSDAIALALRTGAPIYVHADVVDKAKAFDVGSDDPEKLRQWFETLSADELGQHEM
jgi:bifunctional DNase/RNase